MFNKGLDRFPDDTILNDHVTFALSKLCFHCTPNQKQIINVGIHKKLSSISKRFVNDPEIMKNISSFINNMCYKNRKI
jgi:hypothetical protein